MKCIICKKNLDFYKSVNNEKVYQCINCHLAVIGNKKDNKNRLKKIYNQKNYSRKVPLLKSRYRKLAHIISRYKAKGKLLDIGAGLGLFASIIGKFSKYDIDLLEPEQETKYFSKGLIYRNNLEEFLKRKHKKYDVVTMFDVIEHFIDPKENLIKLRRIINQKSILVIQTPNYMSLMAGICKNWSWWMVEDHKFIFSSKSIKLLLDNTGYKIEYFSTYENLYDFKKNLDGNFTNIGNPLLKKILKVSFYLPFFSIYLLLRQIIWKLGYGGLIFLVAERKS